jgi:NAD(P)H-nitrite reductase large subunit
MKIDRCVCSDIRFTELLVIASKNACKSVADLQAHCDFAQNCKRCKPYVTEMLKTQQVIFYDLMIEGTEEAKRAEGG